MEPAKIEKIKASEIKPYEKNAKMHSKTQIVKIAESIKRFGFNAPIVIDRNNVLVCGHGRYAASQFLGFKDVIIGVARAKTGEHFIPAIRVEDLSEDEIKAFRLADNKLNESEWNMDLALSELKGLDLQLFDLTGFDRDLLLDQETKDDALPDSPKKAKTKPGDIYELGGHRVICGDSTSPETMAKLMGGEVADMCFTDPPYNVAYEGGMGTHKQNKRQQILNDDMSEENFYRFLQDALTNIVSNVRGGVYVCMSSSELGSLKRAFEQAGGHWQSFIIWVKNNFTLSRADYQNTYEPILYGWPAKTKKHFFIDDRGASNVWEDLSQAKVEFDGYYTTISFQGFKVRLEGKVKGQVIKKKQRTDIWRHDKPNASKEHPTMKPVALVEEAIKNSSRRKDIVLDSFLGSGSTLIACEKSERRCFGIELDPKFVDVIVQRWVNYTEVEDIVKNGKTIKWQKEK